jgi:hypothetical protein
VLLQEAPQLGDLSAQRVDVLIAHLARILGDIATFTDRRRSAHSQTADAEHAWRSLTGKNLTTALLEGL